MSRYPQRSSLHLFCASALVLAGCFAEFTPASKGRSDGGTASLPGPRPPSEPPRDPDDMQKPPNDPPRGQPSPAPAPSPAPPPDASPPADRSSPPAAGSSGGGFGDCRDMQPDWPWAGHDRECVKCYTCPGEGVFPSAAFMNCYIDGECYRFVTVDNCNYSLYPTADEDVYCRKDGPNYTFFECRIDGEDVELQTVDGTHYAEPAELGGVGGVAGMLPIPGGCSP